MGYPLLDILYPPHCFLCGEPLRAHGYICDDCLNSFQKISDPVCEKCGKPALESGGLCSECAKGEREFFLARSWGIYKPGEPLAESISGLKYEGERALARELGTLLGRGKTELTIDRVDGLTYVPLSQDKLEDRGFNQAELLAREFAREKDIPLFHSLVKQKPTKPQAELSREERLVNVRGSFACEESVEPETVLLIDDVFTTGATVDECSKVLKGAGAERVYVATLARSY